METTFEIKAGLSYEDYRLHSGVNAGLLATVNQFSLRHAKAQIDGLVETQSNCLDFGTAFHALFLEGRVDYVIQPTTYPAPANHEKVKKGEIDAGDPLPWNANAGHCKLWAKEQFGRTILTETEAAAVQAMAENVRRLPELNGLLKGRSELSIFAEKNGIARKIRIDLLPDPEDAPIIDFKSTRSAEPSRFVRQAYDLDYALKGAFYADTARLAGIDRKEFWFVAVEKAPPYAACVVKYKDQPLSFLRAGRARYRAALKKLAHAIETDCWPSYEACEAETYAKPWMLPELEQTA